MIQTPPILSGFITATPSLLQFTPKKTTSQQAHYAPLFPTLIPIHLALHRDGHVEGHGVQLPFEGHQSPQGLAPTSQWSTLGQKLPGYERPLGRLELGSFF